MKNLYYGAIVLGIIGIAAGVYLMTAKHHLSTYAAFAAGAVLLIVGIVGLVMKSKATA